LGVLIVSGKYCPGDLLGGEISSSEPFEVSRTAYREAVRILAAKGLVDARPKVGTRLNPQSMWHLLDPDVLDWTFESEPAIAANEPVKAQAAMSALIQLARIDTPISKAVAKKHYRRRHSRKP
jgi:DNA-binding transcriptional MocR family regulator